MPGISKESTEKHLSPPSLMVAALRGGSGKTILSLGLIAAWRGRGYEVAPFKKGPDFIDPGWLSLAAGRPCYNLDAFLMSPDQIRESLIRHSARSNLSLIEGNRGLYDGLDLEGTCSSAELAKLLGMPVLMLVDVTMTTRTVAAVVRGCQSFDPGLEIGGIVLNRVGGRRQETLAREAIEKYCSIPVVGAIPRLKSNTFPERHMGLVPHQERKQAEEAILWTKATVEDSIDLDKVWSIAVRAETFVETGGFAPDGIKGVTPGDAAPRIGYIRDRAFWFYYPENLEQLEHLGARLVEINALSDLELPPIDALYIGGGFPETQARALAHNQGFRSSLNAAIENGLPVYAECGGLMYLGESLIVDSKSYPMVGALPLDCLLRKRPQGHGYTVLEVEPGNLYYSPGETVRGHEFHYSVPKLNRQEDVRFGFKVTRGRGLDRQRDGLCRKNVLATYTHVHAGGNPLWARGLYRMALQFRSQDQNFSRAPKRIIDNAERVY